MEFAFIRQQSRTTEQGNYGAATTNAHNFVFYITLDLKTVKKWKKQPVHGKIALFSLFIFCHFQMKIKNKNI